VLKDDPGEGGKIFFAWEPAGRLRNGRAQAGFNRVRIIAEAAMKTAGQERG
jgi:hypothetical protein